MRGLRLSRSKRKKRPPLEARAFKPENHTSSITMESAVFCRAYSDKEINFEHLKQAASIVDEHHPEWNFWTSLRVDWHLLQAEQEAEEVEQ